MTNKIEVSWLENREKGQTLKIRCLHCRQKTSHIVLLNIEENGTEYVDSHNSVDWHENYQTTKCLGCETVCFRQKSYFSEDDPDSYTDDEYNVKIYPERDSRELQPFYYVPYVVRNIYHETTIAFNKKAYLLCTAGVRATLEALCADQNIKAGLVPEFTDGKPNGKTKKSKKLDGKIYGLAENGVLTQTKAEILHTLRFMGNKALHDLKEPSLEELELALNILENILEHVYGLQADGNRLKVITEKNKI